MKTASALFLAAAVAAGLSSQNAHASVEVGKPAPDFTLTDVSGAKHSLSEYKGKIVVLEWVNPGCPFVKKHYNSGNMPKLQKSAEAEGVVWLTINSAHKGGEGDLDAGQIKAWFAGNGGQPSDYFRDQDGTVGRLYGAKQTPDMYVIDKNGDLAYSGAIDSIASPDPSDIAKADNYVRDALSAVEAGKPVAVATSRPYGCFIKY